MNTNPLATKHALRRGADRSNPIRRAPSEWLEIQLVFPPWLTAEITERPLSDFSYTLEVGSLRIWGKTTLGTGLQGRDGDPGILREKIPGGISQGRLTIWPSDQRYDIARPLWTVGLVIGELPPVSRAAGAAKRLTNLGLFAGDIPETEDEALRRGIDRFVALFLNPRHVDLYKDKGWADIGARIEEIHGS